FPGQWSIGGRRIFINTYPLCHCTKYLCLIRDFLLAEKHSVAILDLLHHGLNISLNCKIKRNIKIVIDKFPIPVKQILQQIKLRIMCGMETDTFVKPFGKMVNFLNVHHNWSLSAVL